MRALILLFIVLGQLQVHGQYGQFFSVDLYFEDAQGRTDTLTVGYDLSATSGIDEQFGEVNILGTPNDEFDLRFFTYENADEIDLPFTCEHQNFDLPLLYDDIALHESKVSITSSGCSNARTIFTSSIFTIPYDSAFPITIRWDKTPFVDDYGCGAYISWISELSRGEFIQGDWCPERINYDSISLTSLDSIILESPNFKTIAKKDSTLLSVYHIYLTDFGDIGQVSTTELHDSNVNIYPNPTQDKLYIDGNILNYDYQILNLQGQQMLQGKYLDFIAVDQLPSGIYFLQLSREEQSYKAIKFVKE